MPLMERISGLTHGVSPRHAISSAMSLPGRAYRGLRSAVPGVRNYYRDHRKEVLTAGGYAAFGLVLFLFFTYLTFPFQELKGRVETLLEGSVQKEIEIQRIEPTVLPGVILRGISISGGPEEGGGPIRIDKLRLRMGVIPLLWGTHAFSGQALFYGGKGAGTVKYRKNSLAVDLTVGGLHLEDVDYLAKRFGIDVRGTVTAGMHLEGARNNSSQYKGRASFRIDKGGIGQSSFMGLIKIPSLDIDDAHGSVVIAAGRGVLDDFQIKGKDIDVQVSGDVILQNVIGQSILNLKGRFKPSEALAGSLNTILPYMNLQKDAQGYYLFSVTGTLAAPWMKN